MLMSPGLRKLTLTAHVGSSVGWLGAVLGFVALAVAGLQSADGQLVRGSYQAMEVIGRYAIAPLSLASFTTGLIQGLGTRWGLFRHYWVIAKLAINVVSTVVLLSYLQTLNHLALVAADPTRPLESVRSASPLLHAGAATVLLAVAMVLSIYKPKGITAYGFRKERSERALAT